METHVSDNALTVLVAAAMAQEAHGKKWDDLTPDEKDEWAGEADIWIAGAGQSLAGQLYSAVLAEYGHQERADRLEEAVAIPRRLLDQTLRRATEAYKAGKALETAMLEGVVRILGAVLAEMEPFTAPAPLQKVGVPELSKRSGCEDPTWCVHAFGHLYEFGIELNSRDQVLWRDEVECCRRPGWESGLPCIHDPRFDAIAGSDERSLKVVKALASLAGRRPERQPQPGADKP